MIVDNNDQQQVNKTEVFNDPSSGYSIKRGGPY